MDTLRSLFLLRSRTSVTRKNTILFLFAIIIANGLLMLSFMSWRNMVLSHFLPPAWHTIPTSKLVSMYMQAKIINVGKCPQTCPRKYFPPFPRSDAKYPGAKYYDSEKYVDLPYHSHRGNFLPLLSRDEKVDALYTLEVMAHVLKEAKLDFFLVDGTLLGLVRNHAMIPWDDDIDVAVNGSQWKQLRDVLCCVEGFTLRMKPNMHWRFFMTSAMIVPRTPDIRFPFVDMFLFQEDEEYVYSMTNYNLQNLAFLKSYVFPLTSTTFEGLRYPVPRDPNTVIRQQFGDLERCVSAAMFHKYNHALSGSEVSKVPCSLLHEMYDFYDGLDV